MNKYIKVTLRELLLATLGAIFGLLIYAGFAIFFYIFILTIVSPSMIDVLFTVIRG